MIALIRGAVLIGTSLFILFFTVSSVLAQYAAEIENERRMTKLETTVALIAVDVAEIKKYQWLGMLGLAGLVGETGLRAIKRKRLE